MRVLVIGGSASGKSEFAEMLIADGVALGERAAFSCATNRFYLATMEPFGAEGVARIARHREMRRERGFETIECFANVGAVALPARGDVLLEDIGNLVANELYRADGAGAIGEPDVARYIADGVLSLAAQCETLVVVSNDVAREAADFDDEMQGYLAAIGRVNRYLAAEFDAVYEVVAGSAERVK